VPICHDTPLATEMPGINQNPVPLIEPHPGEQAQSDKANKNTHYDCNCEMHTGTGDHFVR